MNRRAPLKDGRPRLAAAPAPADAGSPCLTFLRLVSLVDRPWVVVLIMMAFSAFLKGAEAKLSVKRRTV